MTISIKAPLTNVIFYCPLYWSLIQYNLERKKRIERCSRLCSHVRVWTLRFQPTGRALVDDEESPERRGLSVSEIAIVDSEQTCHSSRVLQWDHGYKHPCRQLCSILRPLLNACWLINDERTSAHKSSKWSKEHTMGDTIFGTMRKTFIPLFF